MNHFCLLAMAQLVVYDTNTLLILSASQSSNTEGFPNSVEFSYFNVMNDALRNFHLTYDIRI